MVEQRSPKPLVRVQLLLALPYARLVKWLTHKVFNLTFKGSIPLPSTKYVGITQLVEFQSSKLAVAGSSPVSHSIYIAGLAQLVAQLTCNQWVSGSSPEAGTIFLPTWWNW